VALCKALKHVENGGQKCGAPFTPVTPIVIAHSRAKKEKGLKEWFKCCRVGGEVIALTEERKGGKGRKATKKRKEGGREGHQKIKEGKERKGKKEGRKAKKDGRKGKERRTEMKE
jgi:hypothetical protein